MLDFLIINGLVIDGISTEPKQQNIGISADRIVYIGSKGTNARQIIDAEGFYITPGFIDVHAHSEFNLLLDGRAEGKLSQGITSEINGNCGFSAAPLYDDAFQRRGQELKELGIDERWHTFQEYLRILQTKSIALNYITLCGHGNLRASVIGYENMHCDKNALNKMQNLFYESLVNGACGLSTGLIYPPGIYSDTKEIIELLRIKPPNNKPIIYTSHMRSEGDELLEAIEEVIKIARGANVRVHISHIKTSGEENWQKLDGALSLLENARDSGVNITCDSYPYTASSTDLDTVLPAWTFAGGVSEEIRRLKDSEISKRIRIELSLKGDKYWKNVYISSVRDAKNKWMEGRSIFDISLSIGKKPEDAVVDIIIKEKASAGAIFFTMNEDNLKRILKLPYTMIGSDSSARSFSGPTFNGKPHPRGFGTFPRFIGVYVRDDKIIDLPTAIERITSLPAKTFGIKERGIIKEGFFADIVIFDYNQIKDMASYKEPFTKSKGIEYVFINGNLAVKEGEFIGSLSGRVLS